MKYLSLLVLCLLIAFPAFAQDSRVVTQSWSAPAAREDGSPLAASEIGGYDLQYRKVGTTDFTSVKLPNTKNVYELSLPYGAYDFRIACYDVNNLYSSFAVLSVKLQFPPKAPGAFKVVVSTTTAGTVQLNAR